jgi:hypothetical protein
VEDPKHTYWSEDGRNNVHHFRSFNFTASVRWSPYLARIEEKLITWPDNVTESVRHVYLDEPDEMWVTAAVGADILQLSTGEICTLFLFLSWFSITCPSRAHRV